MSANAVHTPARRRYAVRMKRRAISVIAAALLSACLLSSAGQSARKEAWDPSKYPEATAQLVKQAEEAYAAEKYELALKLYLNIEKAHPEIPLAHIGAAASAAHLDQNALAVKHYRIASAALPHHGSLLGELGDALMRLERHNEAEASYLRALETDAQMRRASWMIALGSIATMRNRHEQAAEWCRKALEMEPNNATGRHNLASAMLRLNRLDEADEQYQLAIQLNPRNAKAFFGRAQIAQRRGNFYAARDRYLRAAELNPYEPTYHYAAAQTMLRLGDRGGYQKALQKYRRAKSETYYVQALNYMRKKEWKSALARLLPAVETDPLYAVPRRDLAFCYLRLGQLKRARAEFLTALKLEPNSPSALLYLGVCEFQSGRMEEAERRFRQTIQLQPNTTEAYQQLTRIYEAQNRLEEAVQTLNAALKMNAEWAPGLWRRGRAQARLGRTAEAERDLRASMRIAPASPFPKMDLARLLAENGRGLDEALKLAEEAHETAQSPQSAAAFAVALHARGEAEAARRLLNEALQKDPRHTDVLSAQEIIETGETEETGEAP